MHPAQAMGQAPFFYYNPDPTSEKARQHGHFTPHPSGQQQPHMYHPHGLVFQRPSSSSSSPSTPYQGSFSHNMTPVASPQPMYQKPTILIQPGQSPFLRPLDTSFDMNFSPATPPLSSCGSSISSPPSSCDILPTPVLPFFPGEAMEGVKQGCEEEVFSEILAAGAEWRSASPPMTPGKQSRCIGGRVHVASQHVCGVVEHGELTRQQSSSSRPRMDRDLTSFPPHRAPRYHLRPRRCPAQP